MFMYIKKGHYICRIKINHIKTANVCTFIVLLQFLAWAWPLTFKSVETFILKNVFLNNMTKQLIVHKNLTGSCFNWLTAHPWWLLASSATMTSQEFCLVDEVLGQVFEHLYIQQQVPRHEGHAGRSSPSILDLGSYVVSSKRRSGKLKLFKS
jgi:hypothetical protein